MKKIDWEMAAVYAAFAVFLGLFWFFAAEGIIRVAQWYREG